MEAYGFKTYYHDDVFYYPIPTGGPLYEKFLTMVNDAPTRATIIEAMDIASSIDTPSTSPTSRSATTGGSQK